MCSPVRRDSLSWRASVAVASATVVVASLVGLLVAVMKQGFVVLEEVIRLGDAAGDGVEGWR